MLEFHALPTQTVRALQNGEPDFYDQEPEISISDGISEPCRHCLGQVPKDASMLVLSYRPFPEPQPYAEVGPIFLCAEPCDRFETSVNMPPILQSSATYLIKGYSADNRIKYGTGVIAAQSELANSCDSIFADPTVEYIHVRSATNNCYLCLVTRI